MIITCWVIIWGTVLLNATSHLLSKFNPLKWGLLRLSFSTIRSDWSLCSNPLSFAIKSLSAYSPAWPMVDAQDRAPAQWLQLNLRLNEVIEPCGVRFGRLQCYGLVVILQVFFGWNKDLGLLFNRRNAFEWMRSRSLWKHVGCIRLIILSPLWLVAFDSQWRKFDLLTPQNTPSINQPTIIVQGDNGGIFRQ